MHDPQIVSGPPQLTQAAADAVLTWQYEPATLNGIPLQVVTTIIVNFR